MRSDDAEGIQKTYQQQRLLESVFGIFVSIVGFAILFWLPAPEWLRHMTGWLVILYGGTYINKSIVNSWYKTFGKLIPWIGRTNDS